MSDERDVLSIMEKLRADDWCVVLKCLPDGFPWIAEGDPSEYGGGGESTVVSREPWCAESQCMRHDDRPWRHSSFASGATPLDAMQRLVQRMASEVVE